MRSEYDRRNSVVAYLALVDHLPNGGVAETVPLDTSDGVPGAPDLFGINLDFDRKRHLLRVEFLDAARLVHPP
jgi:hypothetical protein